MKKTLDQRFELEDSKQRKADCRVRVFVPVPDEQMSEAVVLVSWAPQVPDFPTGPWLETIVTSFRGGLADVQSELDFLLIEHYAGRKYQMGSILMDFDEELGLVLFKNTVPNCNSPATNLRTGRRKPKAADNAPAVRERRLLHWTPLCREAVEDVVGESLDSPVPPEALTDSSEITYTVLERLVAA
ncbi:hypothetical protein [Armatimonas rosea]|uniref:Uncharacterized protein n=1 Tax=Armatimonas rosea TaxID=685828 RepID=A0A7W9WA46_ARMRO|nr:hypothetical protein [Armatimonas rosea]MBB6053956.1 hypothetical protein [Armatimonas rosea]